MNIIYKLSCSHSCCYDVMVCISEQINLRNYAKQIKKHLNMNLEI